MKFRWFYVIAILLLPAISPAADWIRPGINTNQPIWGIRDGLMWALPPAGFRGPGGGPRGLIRIGYPVLTNGGYDLVNFIAIEPVVKGRKGFSELEHSERDNKQGKGLDAIDEKNPKADGLVPGKLSTLPSGAQQLEVDVRVEPFENGAKVRLVVSQRSDAPDEIKLTIHAEPGSEAMEYCIVTATMGNMARTRELWLKDKVVNSKQLYPDYKEDGFAPHTIYEVNRLPRNTAGDVIMALTTDEESPSSVFPFPGSRRWHYGGFKVTQYWRKARGTFRDDLHAAVNGRYTYWKSQTPIPGGIAFENFELREKLYDGQEFIFGITRKSPHELDIVQRP